VLARSHFDATLAARYLTPCTLPIAKPPHWRGLLSSGQFLAARSHPEIHFRADAAELTPDDELRVPGTMQIRGISAPVELRAHAHGAAGAGGPLRLHLRGTFDRHGFGIRPPQPFEMVVGADVHLEVDLVLERR
jgi:polyisoprenoid-binding protein YceI